MCPANHAAPRLSAFPNYHSITFRKRSRGRQLQSYRQNNRGKFTSIQVTRSKNAETQPKPARLNDARVRHTPSATDQLFTEVLTGGITTKTNEWRRGPGEGVVVIFRSEICDLRVSIYASAYRPLNRLTPESAAWGDEGRNLPVGHILQVSGDPGNGNQPDDPVKWANRRSFRGEHH